MAIGTALALGLGLAGATTGAQVYGAKKAAGTAREAGATQSAAADRAGELQMQLGREALGTQERLAREGLGFQREQWQQAQQNAAPWMQAGRSALGAITGLTGLSGGGTPMGAPRGGGGGGLAAIAGGYAGPEMVSMRAPDGRVRPVPRAMVEHYLGRGGQVVQ